MRLGGAVIGLLLLLPAAAHAASVSMRVDCGTNCANELTVVAGPMEANVIQITPQAGSITVLDSGAATISPGTGCQNASAGNAVICATAPTVGDTRPTAIVDTGDLDDQVVARGVSLKVSGGPGNDKLAGPGAFDGGPGNDEIQGVPEPGDRVTYANHTVGVNVDLVQQKGGGPGELDKLVNIDEVVGGPRGDDLRGPFLKGTLEGGPGNDRLRAAGDEGENMDGGHGNDRLLATRSGGGLLKGGPGDDEIIAGSEAEKLYGESGNDLLRGGSGEDLLRAGRGRDRVFSSDGERDSIDCGPGRDSLNGDRHDRPRRCERRLKREARLN